MNKLLGGRYEILEKIGEGGMAVVYKARCSLLNRYVAIKILKPEFLDDKKFIENFRRESQAAASLNHPNIVSIYDVGTEGHNIHYIVMEYVEGETLSSIIEREGILSDDVAVSFSKQIASALSCAHKNNIIHRDVKPHNILVTDDGVAKITDFGIARAVTNTTLVASDSIMGSVHYFSPEQARGGYVDGKSDLYSLGIMMYEMVTGRVPFDGDNPVSVAMMHLNKEIIPPSHYNPNLSPGLEKVILRATQKYQANRYADADEMLAALDSVETSNSMIYMAGMSHDEEPEEEPEIQETGRRSDTIVMKKGLAPEDYEPFLREQRAAHDNSDEDDDEEEYEYDGYDEPPMTKKQRKADKKAMKAQRKKRKKKKITAPRVLGVIMGIILAVLASIGILWVKDYISLSEVEVPDILGMNYAEAQQLLESQGLQMEVEDKVYSAEYDVDQICEQTPKGGDTVKEGYKIRVSVSKGKSSSGVPSLIDMTLDEAKALIESYGYQVGTIETEDDASAEGTVISQSPEYGVNAPAGTLINLVVSNGKGKEEITMINLIGADLDTARGMLKSANLVLNNIEYEYNDKYDSGVVCDQNVKMGDSVMTGSKINIVVSKGKDPNSSSGGDVNTVPLVLDYTISQNDVFEIKINMVQDGTVTLLHDQVHYKSNNGETINIKGSGKATILIYYDGALVNEGAVDFGTGTFSF